DDIYEPGPGIDLPRLILNLLTALVLLATVGVGLLMVALYVNPYLPINPYPPPTLPATLGWPTSTNTPEIHLPATWTPTVTFTPRPSLTPTVTETPVETPTPEGGEQESTPTPTSYTYEADPQIAMPNGFINTLGCSWMGVGGQVFQVVNSTPVPVQGLNVHLGGSLAGEVMDLLTLTGSAQVLGPSGYVFDLAESPIASVNTLWLQLVDTAGLPVSDKAYITTFASCDLNFVLVNWRQVR
ncbi:MAG: hypothetical protein AB1449_00430, partial [Chloroflexota bacterium]